MRTFALFSVLVATLAQPPPERPPRPEPVHVYNEPRRTPCAPEDPRLTLRRFRVRMGHEYSSPPRFVTFEASLRINPELMRQLLAESKARPLRQTPDICSHGRSRFQCWLHGGCHVP